MMDNDNNKEAGGVQIAVQDEKLIPQGSTAMEDPFDDGIHAESNLGSFLDRPVRIHSQSWAVGAAFTFDIKPVNLWATNAAVRRKLYNYAMCKFDLEITIYVKGTVYHAGMLLVSTRRLGEVNEYVTIGGDTQIITRSQRPSVNVDVGESKSATLTIPYCNLNNYFEVQDPDNTTQTLDGDWFMHLGCDSYTALVGVNTTAPVSVEVFARAINLKLAAPTATAASAEIYEEFEFYYPCSKNTSGGVPPKAKSTKAKARAPRLVSKDEYQSSGPISSVASAVANAAGQLSAVPGIGRFATATEIGANAIGGIASLFGFSRPAEIRDPQPARVTLNSSLALVEGADTTQKMSATAKQELSVDPSTLGIPAEDEMSLDFLCKKQFTYLNQFSWNPTDTDGTRLFYCGVTPMLERVTNLTTYNRIIPTSLSFASRPFRYWSGSLQFRIQIIATRFHNGRIAFIYEPWGPNAGSESSNPYNINFNFVMDLAEGLDQVFEVTWQQPQPYCAIRGTTDTSDLQSTSALVSGDLIGRTNGYWYAQVFNQLNVSDGATPVTVLVSVRAGEDFELMEPQDENIKNLSIFPYVAASDLVYEEFEFYYPCADQVEKEDEDFAPSAPPAPIVLAPSDTTGVDLKSLVYFGERLTSTRQLLKRYTWLRRLNFNLGGVADIATEFTSFPLFPGDSTSGIDVGITTAQPTNYVGQSFITYFAGGYGAWKGAIRYKGKDVSYAKSFTGEVSRFPYGEQGNIISPSAYSLYSLANIDTVSFITQLDALNAHDRTTAGTVLLPWNTYNQCEFEIPYQQPIRASIVRKNHHSIPGSQAVGYPSGDLVSFHVDYTNTGVRFIYDLYVAAGEDFAFYCFNGAPAMYEYAYH